jgi:glycosyltransferase involved in cell wall biosynthesis
MDAATGTIDVTTVIVTHDHAAFIRQAVDSALEQTGDISHEILISEDCSTDGTREIVEEYGRLYPDKIRLLLSDTNVRSNEVVARGIRAARGEFVALLDGDDYWLTPDKLSKQVSFLRAHPTCSMCFTNARVDADDGRDSWNWTPDGHPELAGFEDIARGNFIATCSAMYRSGLVDIPDWYAGFFPITDWPLHILHAERGPIGYVNEVTGVYRYRRGGYYSPLSESMKLDATWDFYRKIRECLEGRHDRELNDGLFLYFVEWAEEYANRGQLRTARACLGRARHGLRAGDRAAMRRYLRNWLQLRMPFARTATASDR